MVSSFRREGTTNGHEGTRMGAAWCSRGRPLRIVLKPGRRKALTNRSAALTADFADVADEEATAGLAELPLLLFQARLILMRSCNVSFGGNHGLTRVHTDPVEVGRFLICIPSLPLASPHPSRCGPAAPRR